MSLSFITNTWTCVDSTQEGPLSETEVRYKLHLCHCHQKQYKEAIAVVSCLKISKSKDKINHSFHNLLLKNFENLSLLGTCLKVDPFCLQHR